MDTPIREFNDMPEDYPEHYVIGWITGEILGVATARQKVEHIREVLLRYHADRLERGKRIPGADLKLTERYVDALRP